MNETPVVVPSKRAQKCREKRAAVKQQAAESGKHYCNKCNSVKDPSEFVPRKRDREPSTMCKDCDKKMKPAEADSEPEPEPESEDETEPSAKKQKTLAYRFNKTKNRIRDKNEKLPPEKQLEFGLTIEEYREIISKRDCRFCRRKDENLDDFTVDRKDDQIGYILENCQCSCHRCNYGKGSTHMTKYTNDQEFISHVTEICKNSRMYYNPFLYDIRVYPAREPSFIIV